MSTDHTVRLSSMLAMQAEVPSVYSKLSYVITVVGLGPSWRSFCCPCSHRLSTNLRVGRYDLHRPKQLNNSMPCRRHPARNIYRLIIDGKAALVFLCMWL